MAWSRSRDLSVRAAEMTAAASLKAGLTLFPINLGFSGQDHTLRLNPHQLHRFQVGDNQHQPTQQLSGVLNGAMRGGGDTKAPMIIGGTGLWLVRLPLSYLLSLYFGLGIMGVWLAMTADLLLRFALSVFRYYRGPWRTMKLI